MPRFRRRTLEALPASAGDAELWKSDGTPNGTQLVKDINPGLIGQLG